MTEKTGKKEAIPIFYFSQLMALAMGEPVKINHFEDHKIDPRTLLKELNFK